MELNLLEKRQAKSTSNKSLNHQLQHLEFISIFEMKLEQLYGDKCSWGFLTKFKQLKQEAQLSVLNRF